MITDSSILKPLILKKLLLVVSIKDALHGNSSLSSVKYVKGAQCFNEFYRDDLDSSDDIIGSLHGRSIAYYSFEYIIQKCI